MVSKVFSCTIHGLSATTIEVQSHISNGLPGFHIVGLGDTSVQESKERVRSGLKNSGAHFPQIRKTINLAPAQIKKQGALFDLPIAISILMASDQLPKDSFQNALIIGELSLTGKIKSISGALLIAQHAASQGFKRVFLPEENAKEAALISGIEIYPLSDLSQLISFARGELQLKPQPKTPLKIEHLDPQEFQNIVGLSEAKRGLIIAAAGGHNVLLSGSPGCGKTVICRSFKSLLPPLNKDEALDVTKIFSITGLLDQEQSIVTKRSFREVHHSASKSAIIGGGHLIPRPGEITLAHHGVLFFDEIAEFPRKILETLRQPLEDKFINISRSHSSIKFPSNFIFLATMNPCPCGFANDQKTNCICTQSQIINYQKKISGPLLDRFDIILQVEKTPSSKLLAGNNCSPNPLPQIIKARQLQTDRFKDLPITQNSDMQLKDISQFCKLSPGLKDFLARAATNLNLSSRGHLKILKIARTIADLDNSAEIKEQHLAEALQFRSAP